MRRLLPLFAVLLPLSVFAQLPAQDSVLYPYKKPMPPATIIESGQGGIPTDGTAMSRQLRSQQAPASAGPTWIYREPGRGKPTFITGPNGTTVCTDANGRVVVCW